MVVSTRWPHRSCVALAALMVASLMVTSRARAADWEPIPAADWEEPARPQAGGGDAIMLLAEGTARDKEGAFEYRVHHRIRIFTDAAREAGKVEIDYLRGRMQLKDVRARSIRRDGTVSTLSPDQIATTTVMKFGGEEYTRASFIVPGIEPGCIVEYGYALSGKLETAWVWPWYFASEYYTRESRFRWETSEWALAARWAPRWRIRRIAEALVTVECVPDRQAPQVVTFVARSIPGWSAEPFAPPVRESGPRVVTSYQRFDPTEYWTLWKKGLDEVGRQFNEKLGSFAKVIADARARHAEPDAALVEIHDWLRDHIRSTAEPSWQQLRDGDRKPNLWGRERSVAGLMESGEGSPFEINLAFSGAANQLGLPSRVILVRDRREGSFDVSELGWLPTSPITEVRMGTPPHAHYFQPASRFALAGSVPWYLRGGTGLVAGSGSALDVSVPIVQEDLSESRWDLSLTLDADGSLAGDARGRLRGERGREWREWLWGENPDRWSELLASEMDAEAMPRLEFRPIDVRAPADSALVLMCTATYHGLAAASGTTMTIPLEQIAPWRLHAEFEPGRRTQPILFRYPRREVIALRLRLPAGATLEALPDDATFENEVGSWSTSWIRLGDGVELTRTIEIREAQVPAAKYDGVVALFGSLAKADRELLLVRVP